MSTSRRSNPRRDVDDFDERADRYESGWLGGLHREIVERTLELALAEVPAPQRVLDIGCGTGNLLRLLAGRCPEAVELCGIDAAPRMIETAQRLSTDGRLSFNLGTAEALPYRDHQFDLAVTTTSFDHWADQQAGLRQCARVLGDGGTLVLVDQFSRLLAPTLLAGRRGKARTKALASTLLRASGFDSLQWHDLYAVLIKAVVARR